MNDDIALQVRKVISEKIGLGLDDLSLDTKLEDLSIDSMKMVDIIFSLEEQCHLTIPFNSNSPELSEFGVSNLRDIVNLMTRLSEEKK